MDITAKPAAVIAPIEKPNTGSKPLRTNIRLDSLRFDANMSQLHVDWTSTNGSPQLKAEIEKAANGDVIVHLHEHEPERSSPNSMDFGFGATVMTNHMDIVPLDKALPAGTTVKVMNGEELVGTYTTRARASWG